jgi:hypothetical protein
MGEKEGTYLNKVSCPHLESLFPRLANAGYEKTSEQTGYPPSPGAYNCIAWAAGDTHHGFWWPDGDSYWPSWIIREETIPCFVRTFHWLGYRVCKNSRPEIGFQKVALYAIGQKPKHMARQLRDGTWTSKCGGLEDITHFTLDAVECHGPYPPHAEYGSPLLYMKRFVVASWVVTGLQFLAWKIDMLRGRL